jgi:hypothetical protein
MLCDLYLPYATGGGYLLGTQLVTYLAENAQLVDRFFNEDVSVGAWLAPLNVTRVHDTRFDTEWKVLNAVLRRWLLRLTPGFCVYIVAGMPGKICCVAPPLARRDVPQTSTRAFGAFV